MDQSDTLSQLAAALFGVQSPNDDKPIVREAHKWWGRPFTGFGSLRFDDTGTSTERIPIHYNQLPRRTVTDGYAGSDYDQTRMKELATIAAAALAQPPRGGAGKRGF